MRSEAENWVLSIELDALSQVNTLLNDAKSRNITLCKENKALKTKVSRAPGQKIRAVEKAAERARVKSIMYHLKEKGVIPHSSRGMLRDLVGLGIGVEHVDETIQTIAKHLGVNIRGNVSERTVSHATLEASQPKCN
jgi:hypothetical protein